MPKDIKIWKVENGERLIPIEDKKLDFEARLEEWLKGDPSLLSEDLLVIGQQVNTQYGSAIDLLCLDSNGDTVIVELKRAKTPRETVAQALDYATWVKDLSNDEITNIAERFLAGGISASLEDAFREKFDKDLPEVLNESHSILVVGSTIDSSSERIIEYLSDGYGVNINAVAFQYFKEADEGELLGRVFLIPPDKPVISRRSKRKRNLTLEELQDLAEEKGVLELYLPIVEMLEKVLSKNTRRSALAFQGDLDGVQRTIFSLVLTESDPENGLYFQIYAKRFCQFFDTTPDAIKSLLPENIKEWKYTSKSDAFWSGYAGYFQTSEAVARFVAGIESLEKRK